MLSNMRRRMRKQRPRKVRLGVQLENSLRFVERSEKRVLAMDAAHAKEQLCMEEAKQCVEHLRFKFAASDHHHVLHIFCFFGQQNERSQWCTVH